MSKVWYVMLLSAVTALLFTDPGKAVTAMIAGSHASVKLAIELAALYGFWLGLFGIIEKIGLADLLGRLLRPVVKFLFPGLNEKGGKYVTMNMAANLLGLGNAATPMAIKAIKEMDDGGTKASQNMIMLTVISATSLQLLPTTVIGLRATHGSVSPADFLAPATIATVISTVIGITAVKLIGLLIRKRERKGAEQNDGLHNTADIHNGADTRRGAQKKLVRRVHRRVEKRARLNGKRLPLSADYHDGGGSF